jgi:hypothetical protein
MRRFLPFLAVLAVGCSSAFQVVDDRKADAAAVKAEQLQTYAKTHAARNGDTLESLDALATYSGEGETALDDPWGQKFQFRYVADPETQTERLVIWTVVPETGVVIAAPRQLAHLVGPSN